MPTFQFSTSIRQTLLSRARSVLRWAVEGRPIEPYDVLIAGQAKARNLTLITNNVGEFERIKELPVEDWMR